MAGKQLIKTIRSGIPGKRNISTELEGTEFLIRIEDFDRYSVVLNEIGINNHHFKGDISSDAFREKALELDKELGFFMEKLQLLELEANEQCALYRSVPSEEDIKDKKFFELNFSKGKKISFSRVQNLNGDKSIVNMVLSDQMLSRLLDTFNQIVKD